MNEIFLYGNWFSAAIFLDRGRSFGVRQKEQFVFFKFVSSNLVHKEKAMERYMTPYDWAAILDPKSIGQLLGVAIRVVRRTKMTLRKKKMELPVGALSTGGAGSYAKNVTRLRYVVAHLREAGLIVFDSSIFDESLRDLARQKADTTEGQSLYVMHNFYVPLIKSGQIDSLVCLPDVGGSIGAQIARDVALSLAPPLPIRELKEDFFPKRPEEQ